MTLYTKAAMKICYFSDEVSESLDCQVRIESDGEIAISYETDGQHIVYKGRAKGDGHYLLSCENVEGRATLHGFSDSRILEGYWEENGLKGMWRIELGEISDELTGDAEDSQFDEEVFPPPRMRARMRALERHDELEEWDWETVKREYLFPLRDDYPVKLQLPEDMSRKEARRLGRFIDSLAYQG